MNEEEKILNKIYTRFEEEKPPFELNKYDRHYNDGFYQGRLTATEIICRELFGKTGDELTP